MEGRDIYYREEHKDNCREKSRLLATGTELEMKQENYSHHFKKEQNGFNETNPHNTQDQKKRRQKLNSKHFQSQKFLQ